MKMDFKQKSPLLRGLVLFAERGAPHTIRQALIANISENASLPFNINTYNDIQKRYHVDWLIAMSKYVDNMWTKCGLDID